MEGYQYKKAGVIITEITEGAQLSLFDNLDCKKRDRLMHIRSLQIFFKDIKETLDFCFVKLNIIIKS